MGVPESDVFDTGGERMDREEETAFALKVMRARIDRHQEALNTAHADLEALLREKIVLLEKRVKELERG
jgi:hypothetical protein